MDNKSENATGRTELNQKGLLGLSMVNDRQQRHFIFDDYIFKLWNDKKIIKTIKKEDNDINKIASHHLGKIDAVLTEIKGMDKEQRKNVDLIYIKLYFGIPGENMRHSECQRITTYCERTEHYLFKREIFEGFITELCESVFE